MTLIDDFCNLFWGRTDAVGLEHGGALRAPDPGEGGWWRERMRSHLEIGGDEAIGVYPVVNDSVRWGCIDFDEGDDDSLIHAQNTVKVLKRLQITGWIERSRSKGFHVWVFADRWIPAVVMRQALLASAQLVDAPMREINPKQDTLRPDQLGNYVRLCYPGWGPFYDLEALPSDRRVVLDLDIPADAEGHWGMTLEAFVQEALATRCSCDQLERMAEFYQQPQAVPRYQVDPSRLGLPVWSRLDGLTRHMAHHGLMPDQDRSSYLWKLANSLLENSELTDTEALEVLRDAHDTHTPDKFAGRGYILEQMFQKARANHD